MLERLASSLETCPIVKRGEYNYFIHPITDGVPEMEPGLIREITAAFIRVLDLDRVDTILVAEAMGIPLGTALSLATDIPLSIVRKRSYSLPGEVAVHQTTGYSKGELYMNGIVRGDRVAIVDDVISTGGTLRALVQALGHVGAEIADIGVVIQRGSLPDIGRPIKTLARIDVAPDRVHVIDTGC